MNKALPLMAMLLLLLWLVPGCFGSVTGSGNLETRDFDYSDFTSLEVGNAFRVEVTPSESFSISITLDDNRFDYLYVSKSGETLQIRLKSGYLYSNHTAIAEVTMPEIQRLELSGATSGTVEGFSSIRDFTAEISGASSLDIALVTTGDVDFGLSGASSLAGNVVAGGDARFDLSGASSISLSGSADDLNADASGASHLELDDFTVRNATIEFSGASNGTINMDGTLNVDLSGASHLYYIGEVILGDTDISGGSSISRK